MFRAPVSQARPHDCLDTGRENSSSVRSPKPSAAFLGRHQRVFHQGAQRQALTESEKEMRLIVYLEGVVERTDLGDSICVNRIEREQMRRGRRSPTAHLVDIMNSRVGACSNLPEEQAAHPGLKPIDANGYAHRTPVLSAGSTGATRRASQLDGRSDAATRGFCKRSASL